MEKFNPISTYRIQFHKDFTFLDAEKILPYLGELGIGAVYASPIFAAVPGSMHGYDVINPLAINPEIGTLKQLRSLVKKLKASGIAWIQDIVPNHMAFHPQNQWLMDVLEKGEHSLYASFFDTAYSTDFFEGKMMVPFLGDQLDSIIERNELQLVFNEGKLYLVYFDQYYPVNHKTYELILEKGKSIKELAPVFEGLKVLGPSQDALLYHERFNNFLKTFDDTLKVRRVSTWFKKYVKELNADQIRLREISDLQHYRLVHWQVTDKQINYRRFFTVNSLICVNMQNQQVFDKYHQLIKQLTDEQVFDGLRVDHVDGLYDPTQYLQELRLLVGPTVYVIAEKILEEGEALPKGWPIQGTSGYDFLALVNNLFTEPASLQVFDRFYKNFTHDKSKVEQQIWDKKENFLYESMQGELNNLYRLLERSKLISKKDIQTVGEESLKQALAKILIYCPVYRYYGNHFPLDSKEEAHFQQLLNQIKARFQELDFPLTLIGNVFFKKGRAQNLKQKDALIFYQRLMQFSGPLMAKGVEDTLMYTYSRFIVHNEVGDTPGAFGISVKAFHQHMEKRQGLWPLAISGTATHDTKRGEDVRTRLNVLSNWPKAWKEQVETWDRTLVDESNEHPDHQDRYFIYQNLVGTYPLMSKDLPTFRERFAAYLEKALREAKRHSNWSTPDSTYEEKAKQFANKWIDLQLQATNQSTWLQTLAEFGLFNSVAQLLVKTMAPGVPDIYQGCEGWDFSLVDPDNRRPVDFERLEALLKVNTSLSPSKTTLSDLWQRRNDGAIKQWLTKKLLTCRKEHQELFEKGRYIPLRVRGRYRKEILAFARHYQRQWLITIVPIRMAALCHEEKQAIETFKWKTTKIDWPLEAPQDFLNILNGQKGKTGQDSLFLKDCFSGLPLAVLSLTQPEEKRAAGILMAISSLPGAFGIGDLGPQAYRFARYLRQAQQQYWQILPINPSGEREFYSPYSAFSAMAGNPLFISPELLAEEGWLSVAELKIYSLPASGEIDYQQASAIKANLLKQAYANFNKDADPVQHAGFAHFVEQEHTWLHDFALYLLIKDQFKGQAWHEWPKPYKNRHKQVLAKLGKEKEQALLAIKWQQYIFFKQWQALKQYVNGLGIKFFGDLPFYINHDSVDVWLHQAIFSLDADGKMLKVAGVPPDYFNANGQLWGMPVFKWEILQQQGYQWWVDRMRKNMELFDQLRLDHFRAFYNYWQVAGGEETAKAGEWILGPGRAIFDAFRKALGKLPFVAEDLGDISPEVYDLRDELKLPGMKVLQFAFGEDMADSLHIPHRHTSAFVVYTGTHDNNTTVGWFKEELKEDDRDRLKQYLGKKVTAKNVHERMIQLAYASVADLVVIPMQDVIGLDEKNRMNRPATVENNWKWRLKPDELNHKLALWLRTLVNTYGR